MRAARALALAPMALLLCCAAASAATPRDVISETVDQVIVVLKADSLDSPAKRKRIEGIAEARFDFDTMSRLVLARNWGTLTPEERTQFTDEFRRHLSVTYGRNVDSYNNETVEVKGDREEARGDWTVNTTIMRGGGDEDVAVDYRLRRGGEEWKVIDVTIEGVSLIANFRSQFQEIVSSGGTTRLLQLLREKNAAGESLLPRNSARGGSRLEPGLAATPERSR